MYAKMALLMFYPYRTLKDLQIKKIYWNLFNKQRQLNIKKKQNKFWNQGFEILQNIEDRSNIQKNLKKYMEYARRKEAVMLVQQQNSISQIEWNQT
jgi:hypothetical protein